MMKQRFSRLRRVALVACVALVAGLSSTPVFAQTLLPDPGVDIDTMVTEGVTTYAGYLAVIIAASFAFVLLRAAWRNLRRVGA